MSKISVRAKTWVKPDQVDALRSAVYRCLPEYLQQRDGAIVANLSQADLSDADLSKTDLSGVILENSNLSGAKLSQSDLFGTKLSGASVRAADLTTVRLVETEMEECDSEYVTKSFLSQLGADTYDKSSPVASFEVLDGIEFI